ncbi:hypothetical protein D9757_007883 [Collybiopsis confluens]|uniref:Uncharacterized protein n=1 Tax=Collybiopsis confluens TaxID=2823264 RepID=A0A8H5HDB1_9AGAR|nr:hypothetical protein D9757_007883 [Collybiopsis confluens]
MDGFDYFQWSYHSFCALIAESALYGIYVTLMAYAIRHLWFQETNRTKAHLATLITLLLMFSMSTTLWAMDILDNTRGFKQVYLNTSGTLPERAEAYKSELNQRFIIQTTIFSLEYLIGDTVVAWRACALWGYRRAIVIVPVVLLSSATILVSFFVGCLGLTHWTFLEYESQTCADIYLSVFFLSLSTNAVATTLVAVKAWMHYRLLLSASVAKRTRVLKVLVLLVESGLIYFLIWGAKSMGAFGNLPSSDAQFTVNMLNMLGNQVVGLYPTLLVILVRMQVSAFKSAEIETANDWGRSTTVHGGDSQERATEEGMVFARPSAGLAETLAAGTSSTIHTWPLNESTCSSPKDEGYNF